MEKKPYDPSAAEPQEELHAAPAESTPETDPVLPDETPEQADEEQHSHGNYMFALKVLKASGVPIAIKEFLPDVFSHIQPALPGIDLLHPLF